VLLAAHKHLLHPCLIIFAACLQASFSLEVLTSVAKIVMNTNYVVDANFCMFLLVWSFDNSGLSYGVDDQSLRDAFASFGDVVEGEFGFFRCCYLVVPF